LFPTEESKGPKTQGKFGFVQNLLRGAIALLPTKANEGNEVWDLSFLGYLLIGIQGSKKTSNFF
jgi:hypothetical protein